MHFFSSVPGTHRLGRAVSDTVPVLRLGESDSVSKDGVDLAFDLLDRARQTRRAAIVDRIERVLSTVPSTSRIRTSKPGRREGDLVAKLSGQSLINQVVILRADHLVITDVSADTVDIRVEDPSDSTATRTDRWLSLVVLGQTAVVDSL